MKMQYDLERINRENFRSSLEALARPGVTQPLISLFDSELLAMASVLLYAEVSYHYDGSDDFSLIRAMCGARDARKHEADYLFADRPDLTLLEEARTGGAESPEFGATLLFRCSESPELTSVALSGPGIQGARKLTLPLSVDFIRRLAEKNQSFPMGVDLFLIIGDRLIGLPRTTRIEVVA